MENMRGSESDREGKNRTSLMQPWRPSPKRRGTRGLTTEPSPPGLRQRAPKTVMYLVYQQREMGGIDNVDVLYAVDPGFLSALGSHYRCLGRNHHHHPNHRHREPISRPIVEISLGGTHGYPDCMGYVALDHKLYMIGGVRYRPGKDFIQSEEVFVFDIRCNVVSRGPSLAFPKGFYPIAIAVKGKIFVFPAKLDFSQLGENPYCIEVLDLADLNNNGWRVLPIERHPIALHNPNRRFSDIRSFAVREKEEEDAAEIIMWTTEGGTFVLNLKLNIGGTDVCGTWNTYDNSAVGPPYPPVNFYHGQWYELREGSSSNDYTTEVCSFDYNTFDNGGHSDVQFVYRSLSGRLYEYGRYYSL